MGGLGSTRWGSYIPRTTVQECMSLDIKHFKDHKAFTYVRAYGSIGYPRYTLSGRSYFHIDFEIKDLSDGYKYLILQYERDLGEGPEQVTEPIRLQVTRPYFGGIRWWFTCPAAIDGKPCGRRARMLYLPSYGKYFACRRCHDLTYKSVQEHDKVMDRYMKNPSLVLREMLKPTPNFKALMAWFRLFEDDEVNPD